jgi:hypothetical protein
VSREGDFEPGQLIDFCRVHLAHCTIDPNVGDELSVNLIRQLKPSWATDHSMDMQIACNAASTFCPYFAVPDQFVTSDQDRK